jgi:hypothetical protein
MKKAIILLSSFILGFFSLFFLLGCDSNNKYTVSKSEFNDAMKYYLKDNYRLTYEYHSIYQHNDVYTSEIYERIGDKIKCMDSNKTKISFFRAYESGFPLVDVNNNYIFDGDYYNHLLYSEESNKYYVTSDNGKSIFGNKLSEKTSIVFVCKFLNGRVVYIYYKIGSCNEYTYTIEYDAVKGFEDNLPEYLYDYSSVGDVDTFFGMSYGMEREISINSKLKVKTDIDIKKDIELSYQTQLYNFYVDDPNLESLSKKEILEMYSDFDQMLSYKITRYIRSYEEKYSNYTSLISKDVIYSKEDTLEYLVSDDFGECFPSDLSFKLEDIPYENGKYYAITYELEIKPTEDEKIKLFRPVSSREASMYDSLNQGDLINILRSHDSAIDLSNYYKFYVKDDKIHILPYDEKLTSFIVY